MVDDAQSSWRSVASGVPQGSVLGPTLFLLYINDLPEVSISNTKLFADDTKVSNPVPTDQDIADLQDDINAKAAWSEHWQISFNASKCKTMHLGRSNPKHMYTMGQAVLESTATEKDLGVTLDQDLSFTPHTNIIIAKAAQRIGMIRRSFRYLDTEAFLALYKSKVRSVLEYASPVWAPSNKKDAKKIETVQARATKLLPALRNLTYPDRLRRLGLPSLEYRRMRADMIQIWKIVHGIDQLSPNRVLPPFLSSASRGHNLRLEKQRPLTAKYSNVLRFRAINAWNSLPQEVVSAPTLNCFKSLLNKAWNDHPLKFCPTSY